METKTHIFCQVGPGEKFAYGNGRFTENEVASLIKMLPPINKVIKIVWVKAEYPEWHPGHPNNREKLNDINENGNHIDSSTTNN